MLNYNYTALWFIYYERNCTVRTAWMVMKRLYLSDNRYKSQLFVYVQKSDVFTS